MLAESRSAKEVRALEVHEFLEPLGLRDLATRLYRRVYRGFGSYTIGELVVQSTPWEVMEKGKASAADLDLLRTELGRYGLRLRDDPGVEVPTDRQLCVAFQGVGNIHSYTFDSLGSLKPYVIDDFGVLTARKLMAVNYFGPTHLRSVRKVLAKYGLHLKDEPIWQEPIEDTFELDELARQMKRAGKPFVIARTGADGNSFPLALASPFGNQLEVRRMPAQSQLPIVDVLKELRHKDRRPIDLASVIDKLKECPCDVARSRIKSVVILAQGAAIGNPPLATEYMFEAGTGRFLDKRSIDLRTHVFTGKHWILCEIMA